MRLTVLASGSGGNAILVEAARTRILVDAGLSARELARRMERAALGTRLEDVQAVCVTHEHTDHVAGVAPLASAGLAVFATEGTARAAGLSTARGLKAGERTAIDELEIEPVALPHDAAEPVGFVIGDGATRAGILTDCGHPSPEVARAFAGCDLLVIEANHDPDMLRAGVYPQALQRRISGLRGHLSNEQAADLLRLIGKPGPQVIVLAHLSQTNNRPRLARLAIERAFVPGWRPGLVVASQAGPAAPVLGRKGRVEVLPGSDDRQLRLAFPEP